MKLECVEWRNFISNDEYLKIDFKRKYRLEDKDKFFDDYIFKRERKDIKSQDGILKTLALVGKNASYKTSILKSVYRAVDFVINFEENIKNWQIKKIDLNRVVEWYKKKNNKSLFKESQQRDFDFLNILNEYLDETDGTDKKMLMQKYLNYFYEKNAFDKKEALSFTINYLDKDKKNNLYEVILSKNNDNKIDFIFRFNNESVDPFKKELLSKVAFTSFDIPKETEKEHLKDCLNYLYFQKFKKDTTELIKFLQILDPAIEGIKVKEFNEKNQHLEIKSIERKYHNINEDITVENLSSGTKTFILYLCAILQNDLIIIDEIEQSLHKKLIDLLLDIAKQNNKQILFSTHSPTVIASNLSMYEFYILDSEHKSFLQKGEKVFRDKKDNYLQKYLKDLVSSIDDENVDYIRLNFY